MLKQKYLKSLALAAAVVCMFLLAACGSEPAEKNTEQTPSQTIEETENDQAASEPSVTEQDQEPEEESDVEPESEPELEPEPSADPAEAASDVIAKINGGADEVGIYSVVVRLTDKAADKGVVEMVYYGAKDSPQKDSIVNTFRIEYYKEEAGTYEISTFFNGEVYQNQHHKDEVKVVNTFDATLRAGNVIISYTPDGGDTQEIFRADAEYFRASEN